METMEFWNMKNLHEPPTFTYKSKPGEVDIDHLHKVLQDGIDFFNGQNLMNQELALLTRVIYRLKAKLRNSKDFKTLEKVKRDLIRFTDIEISNKLEHLASIIPSNHKEEEIFLPTKNMVDFILVRLQGIGKILCRTMELCKLSAEFNECRFRLGHFWNVALISLGIVSRIHILSLHILKFTCLFYVRLLPFSHKLKNPGVNWLPENYSFPKDLKEWLNIDWDKLTEVIEIKDSAFDKSFFDLCEDSDDDIQYCNEYVEVDEDDVEIIEDSNQSSKKKTKPKHTENSVLILRGFATDCIDTGEVILSSDENDGDELERTKSLTETEAQNKRSQLRKNVEVISCDTNQSVEQLLSKESNKILPSVTNKASKKNILVKEADIEKVNSSSDKDASQDNTESLIMIEDVNETKESSFRTVDIAEKSLQIEDLGEVILSSDEDVPPISDSVNISKTKTARKTIVGEQKLDESALLISSDEESDIERDNVAEKVACSKQKPSLITCDFIPLQTNSSKDFSANNYSTSSGGISQKFNKNNNKHSEIQRNDNGNVHEISETSLTPKKRSKKKNKANKVKEKINSNKNELPQEKEHNDILRKNEKSIPNFNNKKSMLNKSRTENASSNSGNEVEIREVSTRKRKRSKSAKCNVLNEISEQLPHKDSMPSPRIKSPRRKKRKPSSNKGNEDAPNNSILNVLKKTILKKKKESDLNEKQEYLDKKKYLARKSKRLKKKMLKQGG